MKFPILIVFLAAFAMGQALPGGSGQSVIGGSAQAGSSITGGSSAVGSFMIGGTTIQLPSFAQLPLNWADDRECNPPGGVFDVTRVIGVNYTANSAGVLLAIQDWVAAPDQWEALQLPFATYTSAAPLSFTSGVKLLGKPFATKCLVIMGTGTVTPNQTLCSHQIYDNNDGSSPRNLGCTNDIAQLAAIEGRYIPGNNGMLFQACAVGVDANCTVGPNHYAFKNLELRPQAGGNFGKFKLFNFDDGDLTGFRGSNHNWILQDYIHADATETGPGVNQVSSLIDWTSSSYSGFAFIYIDKTASPGNEGHLMSATWAPGPLKGVNSWLEGAAINIITGGATATIQPYENVYDVELRRLRLTKPASWMPLTGASQLVLKSDFEVKTATRWLMDGIIAEYSNTSGAQKGQCFTFTPRNTSAGLTGDNYGNSIDNITLSNFICRHAVAGIETASRSGGPGNGGGAATPLRSVSISNGLFYDIAPGTSSIYNSTVNIPFISEVGGGGNNWTASSAVRDPTGTFVTLTLTDGGTGFHKTTMSVGDLVHVQGCTDTSFNTPLHDIKFFAEGPVALAGTQSFITVAGNPVPGPVVYPNVGTPNATTAGCLVFNDQGFQKNFTVRHITVVGGFFGASGAKGQIPSCLSIDAYAQNYTFQDNLIAPLATQYSGLTCQGDGNTEGTRSEGNMADLATFVFNHNVIGPSSTGARNPSTYTDYPGAITPSVGNFFPVSVGCATATADASCVGFASMMNGASYQPNAPTIDGYALDPSSIYIAGQGRQASDGKSLGADITAIKNALQSTQYICLTPCGAGPTPDQ